MANNESIIALQNFINSSAFGLMPQSTQDEIRNNLASMLKQEQEKLLDKVKASIMASASQTLADADIEFSFVVERKNNVVTIKDYKPEPVPVAVIEEESQEKDSAVEETEEKEEGNADETQRNRKNLRPFL